LPQTKNNNIQDFQNQRYIGIFCPNEREREKERGRERERERVRVRARKGKGKRKGMRNRNRNRERERTKARVILFLNQLGQSEKSANYISCTVQERAV
jgi:hypothetical protein